jgi:hypothetical protein
MPPRDAASLANADGASVGRRADAAPAGVALATADGAYAGRSVDASDASASRHRGMRWPPHGISHEEESGSSSRVRGGEEICGIETGKRLWIEERDTKDLFYETVHHETLWQTASYVVDVCRCFDFRWDWKIKKILVGSKGTHLG